MRCMILFCSAIVKLYALSEIYVINLSASGLHASNRGNVALHSATIKMASKYKFKIMEEWKRTKCTEVFKKKKKGVGGIKIQDNNTNKIWLYEIVCTGRVQETGINDQDSAYLKLGLVNIPQNQICFSTSL